MFLGEYKHSLDGKGRVSVPVKFRSELGASAIVTKGLEGCLFLYSRSEWQMIAEKLASLPVSSANARAFSRLMLSGAVEAEIDKLGRILIPSYLRDYAGIDGEVVVNGVYNRIEIWDRKSWGQYAKNAEKKSSEIAETLTQWEV